MSDNSEPLRYVPDMMNVTITLNDWGADGSDENDQVLAIVRLIDLAGSLAPRWFVAALAVNILSDHSYFKDCGAANLLRLSEEIVATVEKWESSIDEITDEEGCSDAGHC